MKRKREERGERRKEKGEKRKEEGERREREKGEQERIELCCANKSFEISNYQNQSSILTNPQLQVTLDNPQDLR